MEKNSTFIERRFDAAAGDFKWQKTVSKYEFQGVEVFHIVCQFYWFL